MLFDQVALGDIELVSLSIEEVGLGAQQLDGELQAGWPVAQYEASHGGTSFISIIDVLPKAVEGGVRLPYIEDHLVVADQVQI